MKIDDRKILGERIARIRIQKGVKQTYVAEQLGKTPQWLSNIEKGKRRIGATELNQIAGVLGVDIEIFFDSDLNDAFKHKNKNEFLPTGTEGR